MSLATRLDYHDIIGIQGKNVSNVNPNLVSSLPGLLEGVDTNQQFPAID